MRETAEVEGVDGLCDRLAHETNGCRNPRSQLTAVLWFHTGLRFHAMSVGYER